MQKNKLTSLKGFENLTELIELNLAENQINSLEGIHDCDKLKKLNLAQNQIEKFDCIPYLPALEELNLTQCPIKDLKEIKLLGSFYNLNNLNLSETPLAEEAGDNLKKEVLIILDNLKFKMFNGEEVTEDEIQEAKDEKKARWEAAEEARLAAEEEAR